MGGHRWSWRMKLRSKDCHIDFYANQTQFINIGKYLTDKQIFKMASRPEFAIQFAHYLKHVIFEHHRNTTIHVFNVCSLNYRDSQVFLLPHNDLSLLDPWQNDWTSVLAPLKPLRQCGYHQFPWTWQFSNLFTANAWSWLVQDLSLDDIYCHAFSHTITR